MKKIFKSCIFTILITALNITVFAAVPHLLNYQGRLTDKDGKPVADGTYSVTFRLWDAETAGNMLWEETQSVTLQKSIFAVLLGSVTNLGLAFDKPYFLEIKFGTEVMTPRQRITSAGYAIKAETAEKSDTVDGIHASITPEPNKLLPLDASGKVPASALKGFGAWETKSANTVYQAATDGFVIGWSEGVDNCHVTIKTDSANPPVTVRAFENNYYPTGNLGCRLTIFCPVKKSDYWKYESGQASHIYWLPSGS